MKPITLLLLLIIFNACGEKVQQPTTTNGTIPISAINNPRTAEGEADLSSLGTLTFEDTLHVFAPAKEGDVLSYSFKYTNTGKQPVLINEARTSCGCTVPEYKKDPIAVGETGEIAVKFNSEGKQGFQHKKVSILSNGNPAEINLIIEAEIN
jgi:hypothetical protein